MKAKVEKNKTFYFLPSWHGNDSYNLIGSQRGSDYPISDHGHSNACMIFFSFGSWKKINKLFTGLVAVRIVKNCDLGLGRPQEAFSRPRSQIRYMSQLCKKNMPSQILTKQATSVLTCTVQIITNERTIEKPNHLVRIECASSLCQQFSSPAAQKM